jgi:hypothetical protein
MNLAEQCITIAGESGRELLFLCEAVGRFWIGVHEINIGHRINLVIHSQEIRSPLRRMLRASCFSGKIFCCVLQMIVKSDRLGPLRDD